MKIQRPFADRRAAGRALARVLAKKNLVAPVVLALPRGGVPVAAEIASALGAPLDIVLVRKIGVPFQPELAAAAVVDGGDPEVVTNDDVVRLAGVTPADLAAGAKRELEEIERRRSVYLQGRARVPLEGRTIILVDDGIATGASIRAALKALRRKSPKALILAVPVAPLEAVDALGEGSRRGRLPLDARAILRNRPPLCRLPPGGRQRGGGASRRSPGQARTRNARRSNQQQDHLLMGCRSCTAEAERTHRGGAMNGAKAACSTSLGSRMRSRTMSRHSRFRQSLM